MLSKSVIQSIPVYAMMITPLPQGCLKEIQKLQRSFVWGEYDNQRKVHLVNWKTCLLPKITGGLAIRDLPIMNKACLLKLCWQLRVGSSSLWCNIIWGKYGNNQISQEHFIARNSDSFIWKALVNGLDHLKKDGRVGYWKRCYY